MVEEHALDEEAVKKAPIRLLPIHQLTEEQPQGMVKGSSVVEGPAMQRVVEDIWFFLQYIFIAATGLGIGFSVDDDTQQRAASAGDSCHGPPCAKGL